VTGRAAVLLCASALTALAQSNNFVWDYSGTGPWVSPYLYGWVVNGDTTFTSAGGGSAIWGSAVSGTNSNDYEIDTSLLINSPGGTYMHFLRAGTTVVWEAATIFRWNWPCLRTGSRAAWRRWQ
jgi:hypothetical protein